ncbi:MAG: lytic transglycosylase domain-containing protein, partial [Gammaproteobacteria bacterium]
IGYNARAGNEIIIHYLVDYAIKKREHEQGGGIENLARATYAAYHGGPSHLTRYRQRGTREFLRKVDAAFIKKYRAIQANGVSAVRQCYDG